MYLKMKKKDSQPIKVNYPMFNGQIKPSYF